MPYDGNGNFVRVHNWTADAANALDINAPEMDAEDNGFATGLSNAVTRDGQGKMTVDFVPNADNVLNLGSGALRWATINGIPVSSLTPTQAMIGGLLYPQTQAETNAGVTPTNKIYAPGVVDRYGANTTPGTTDMTTAINAAIAVAVAGGGVVNFGPFIYAHASTLVFKNGIIYQGQGMGDGADAAPGARQTVLKYTGNSDQVQVNNPINSSTASNYDIRDMCLLATTATAGKANLADVGSTGVYLRRVRFAGAMINLILDQTELFRVEDCWFQDINNSSTGAAVWLVNGPEHSPGASAGLTNQGLFIGCQFNCAGTTGTLIADDGGLAHQFISCNFQSGSVQLRLNATSNVLIQCCEMEGAGTACVQTNTTKWGGNAGSLSTTVKVDSTLMSTGAVVSLDFSVASSVWNVTLTNNFFSTTSTTILTAGIAVELFAQGNDQNSTGPNRFLLNNYFSAGIWNTTWAASGTQPVLGNGALFTEYDRKGKNVTIRLNHTMGSTTTFGTGSYSWTIPVAAANDAINFIGSVKAISAGTFSAFGAPFVGAGASTFTIQSSGGGWGQLIPATWANGDSIQLAITYKAANWLG